MRRVGIRNHMARDSSTICWKGHCERTSPIQVYPGHREIQLLRELGWVARNLLPFRAKAQASILSDNAAQPTVAVCYSCSSIWKESSSLLPWLFVLSVRVQNLSASNLRKRYQTERSPRIHSTHGIIDTDGCTQEHEGFVQSLLLSNLAMESESGGQGRCFSK